MALDDFFTLTEMNNGLTVPSRVKELVAIMQKQEKCIVKNVNEATRQWSAVGSALAATENKDCLDLFIHLDGLRFIGEWLKNAHKFSNDSSDGFLEESITHLLQALGKLHVDYEKLVATEIWTSVENLILHNNSKVQDKARVLFESWQKKRDGNSSVTDVENCGASADDDDDVGKIHSNSSEKHDEKGQENKNLDKILDASLEDNKASIGSCDRAREDTPNGQTEFQEMEPSSDIKHTPIIESSANKFGQLEDFTRLEDRPLPSNSNVADEIKPVTESSSPKDSVAVNRSLSDEGSPSDAKVTMDNSGSDSQCRKFDQHVSDDVVKKDYKFAKKERLKEPHRASKKSDVELDPLEVARQVAIEVEREVQQSCNSSEKLPEGNVQQPECSDSPSIKQSQASEAASIQEESETSTENLNGEQKNGTQDMDTEKGPCNFDLNEEIYSEDGDGQANQILTPVSIVSASRRVPIAPLQFEGNLGWKGSASTSAFRRLLGSDKDLSSSSRGCLDFDLNVSENIDESHLGFDLNRISEDGARSPSQSHSSSSSSKQLSLKNFDLNDRPSFVNDNFNAPAISILGTRVEVNHKDFVPLPNGRTLDNHACDVNLGRTGPFLGIGSVLPYAHYGYNSVAPGPAMPFSYGPGGPIPYMMDSRGAPIIVGSPSTLPASFSQTPFFMNMAGPSPSIGPPLNGLGAFGPPSNGPGAVGPSRSSVDLKSGTMLEGGNRDPSGFLQFLGPSRVRPVDEQLKPNSGPNIGSAVGGKRKEPENGWEHYPFKHYTPPWK